MQASGPFHPPPPPPLPRSHPRPALPRTPPHPAALKLSQREVWAVAPVRVHPPGQPEPGEGIAPGDWYVVSVCQRVRTKFTQCFDLAVFPFDRQRLRIELLLKHERYAFASLPEIVACEAFRHAVPEKGPLMDEESTQKRRLQKAAQIDYDEALVALGTVSYFQPASYQSPTNTAWGIYKRIGMEVGASWPDESRSCKEYSRCRFLIYTDRKWKHLFNSVVIPYMVCTMSTFTISAIDATSVGERLQVVSALLLTGVGLRFVLQNYLPDSASDTLLESYVLFSILFFLFCAVGVAIAAKVGAHVLLADEVVWATLAAVWVCAHLHFCRRYRAAVAALAEPPKPVTVETCLTKEEPDWRQRRLDALEGAALCREANASGKACPLLASHAPSASDPPTRCSYHAPAGWKWRILPAGLKNAFLESDAAAAVAASARARSMLEPSLHDKAQTAIDANDEGGLRRAFRAGNGQGGLARMGSFRGAFGGGGGGGGGGGVAHSPTGQAPRFRGARG